LIEYCDKSRVISLGRRATALISSQEPFLIIMRKAPTPLSFPSKQSLEHPEIDVQNPS